MQVQVLLPAPKKNMRVWWNWQTRMIQVHMPLQACRFKSCHPHQKSKFSLKVGFGFFFYIGLIGLEPTVLHSCGARLCPRLERGAIVDRSASLCSLNRPPDALATSPVTRTILALNSNRVRCFLFCCCKPYLLSAPYRVFIANSGCECSIII